MAVNLNMLNIGIDQFNAAASGKHNIGQLKLGEDGASVVRTNNHKHWTIFNNTEIRPEESLAIKNAFCKALDRAGVPDDKVEEIRHKLGIAGSLLETLKAGGIKPLSAAEVREIIDECAGDINKSRAPGEKLKTSADIYRGVSQETLADRKTDRDKINADSVAKMGTRAGGTVGLMVDILQSTGRRDDLPLGAKAIALAMLQALRTPGVLDKPGKSVDLSIAPVTLKVDSGGTIVTRFTLDDGPVFSVGTNLTKDELLAQLSTVMGGKGVQGAGQKDGKTSYADLIDDLKKAIAIAKDPAEMERRRVSAFAQLSLDPKNKQFKAEDLKLHAGQHVRDALTNPIVKPLVDALRDIRGMDARNTDLVNQVRAVLYGDKNIDADELVGNITRILTKKGVDVPPNPGKADPLLQKIEDDFNAPLNINALLGNDD